MDESQAIHAFSKRSFIQPPWVSSSLMISSGLIDLIVLYRFSRLIYINFLVARGLGVYNNTDDDDD